MCSYQGPLPGATVRVVNGDPDMLCGSWGEHPLGAGIAGQGPAGATSCLLSMFFDTPVGLFVIQTLAMVVMPCRSVLVDTLTLHPRWGTWRIVAVLLEAIHAGGATDHTLSKR